MKGRKLTENEIQEIRDLTNFKGNVVYSNTNGSAKVIFTDASMRKTREERDKVLSALAHEIEKQYPGFTCTVTED